MAVDASSSKLMRRTVLRRLALVTVDRVRYERSIKPSASISRNHCGVSRADSQTKRVQLKLAFGREQAERVGSTLRDCLFRDLKSATSLRSDRDHLFDGGLIPRQRRAHYFAPRAA